MRLWLGEPLEKVFKPPVMIECVKNNHWITWLMHILTNKIWRIRRYWIAINESSITENSNVRERWSIWFWIPSYSKVRSGCEAVNTEISERTSSREFIGMRWPNSNNGNDLCTSSRLWDVSRQHKTWCWKTEKYWIVDHCVSTVMDWLSKVVAQPFEWCL